MRHEDEDEVATGEGDDGLGAALSALAAATGAPVHAEALACLPESLRSQIRGDWAPVRALLAVWKHRDALLLELSGVDEVCGLAQTPDGDCAIADRVRLALRHARERGVSQGKRGASQLEREVQHLRAVNSDLQHQVADLQRNQRDPR